MLKLAFFSFGLEYFSFLLSRIVGLAWRSLYMSIFSVFIFSMFAIFSILIELFEFLEQFIITIFWLRRTTNNYLFLFLYWWWWSYSLLLSWMFVFFHDSFLSRIIKLWLTAILWPRIFYSWSIYRGIAIFPSSLGMLSLWAFLSWKWLFFLCSFIIFIRVGWCSCIIAIF